MHGVARNAADRCRSTATVTREPAHFAEVRMAPYRKTARRHDDPRARGTARWYGAGCRAHTAQRTGTVAQHVGAITCHSESAEQRINDTARYRQLSGTVSQQHGLPPQEHLVQRRRGAADERRKHRGVVELRRTYTSTKRAYVAPRDIEGAEHRANTSAEHVGRGTRASYHSAFVLLNPSGPGVTRACRRGWEPSVRTVWRKGTVGPEAAGERLSTARTSSTATANVRYSTV
jgi:hypothetical protein